MPLIGLLPFFLIAQVGAEVCDAVESGDCFDEFAALQSHVRQSIRRETNGRRVTDLFDRDLEAEPPRTSKDARFDLPLIYFSGQWGKQTGETIMYQYIWHECLEVTISGNAAYPNGTTVPDSGSPLHHHIANAEYITFDDTGTTTTDMEGYFSYKAIIAAPTSIEAADGATATLVFYVDESMPDITQADGSNTSYTYPAEIAIRYVDSEGRFVFQQNETEIPGSAPLMKMERFGDVPCTHPHPQSTYCSHRIQAQPDLWDAFTPACCGEGYGGSTEVYTSICNPGFASRGGLQRRATIQAPKIVKPCD